MNAITVEHLSKTYGKGKKEVKALEDISFTVPEKSIYGFIGPNGAGKSTTIGIILQFLNQDKGNVHLFDQEVTENSLAFLKKFIGFIPDADLPLLPGYKFLTHTGYYHDLRGSRLREKLHEVIEITDSRSFVLRNTKKLSKGQKSRIKIANALIGEPALIIADEPTAGLDPLARRQFLDLITKLKTQKGTTIFFSNHVIGEVEKICDHVTILSKGKIVANGTIADIINSLPVKNRFLVNLQNCSVEELRSLPGVVAVTQKSPFEFSVEISNNAGQTPEFLKELVKRPVIIDSFTKEIINLEEVFLSIVDN